VAVDTQEVRLRERLVAGDDDALAEAYDRWATLVHTVALRVTGDHAAAEDVTQEVFVYLWQRPEAFRPERGGLRTWLCLLARRRALDSNRRHQVRARYHAAAAAESTATIPTQPGVEAAVTWQTEAKMVREAVLELPEPQRAAVMLAYYGDRSYRQVARELDIPEGTAKSRLRVALATLADRLSAEGILDR
jgi:RNA polymerase sigma-70 factor, ECF subfamily